MENLLSLHIHLCQLLRERDWQSQECSAQPLGGLVKDKSEEEEEQPHPSPSRLACTNGTKERQPSSCPLTPQGRATHIGTASLCHLLYSSREGRKQEHKHSSEQELEAPQLSGTWAQGSLLGSVAGTALRLARTCLFTNQVTGPHAFPSSAPSTLKQSVLAHIYSCHKSVLLLRAACSLCSSHASSHRAVLWNCTQEFLASPFNLCLTVGLSAMVTGTFSQQNLANIMIFFKHSKEKNHLCLPNRIFFSFCGYKTNCFSIESPACANTSTSAPKLNVFNGLLTRFTIS